jgi:hypothetical protein
MSYADVNGISLYYEEHGSGRPLILLHGGLGTADMYAPILPMLAQDRRVIAVDLQGHGHQADVDRPLRYQTLGDDVAALIGHLGVAQADLMRRTSWTSTRCSAAGCATRPGTVRPGRWHGWPSCLATPTTTSSARPTW